MVFSLIKQKAELILPDASELTGVKWPVCSQLKKQPLLVPRGDTLPVLVICLSPHGQPSAPSPQMHRVLRYLFG